MTVDIMGRIAEVKEEDGCNPKVEELVGPQEAHNTRRSPEIDGDEETRSTSLPPSPSRTQEPAGTEDSAAGGPQQSEAFSQGAAGGMQTGSGNEPPSDNQYSSTYAEEIRR